MEEFEVLQHSYIAPQHYSIILKYIKYNKEFYRHPHMFSKLLNNMLKELNDLGIKKEPSEWITLMSDWVKTTNSDFEVFRSARKSNTNFTAEELELISILPDFIMDEKQEEKLSCILDHLEIAGDSPKLWTTICLEMEAFDDSEETEEIYWKKFFEKWCTDVLAKNKLLENYDVTNSFGEKPYSFLTTLELRLLDFLATQTIDFVEEVVLYCRICLTSTYDLSYIFQKAEDDISLVHKINQCSSIPQIKKDDGYPQNICRACVTLAETAYKFKLLCEQSDVKLRSMTKDELIKGEFEDMATTDIISSKITEEYEPMDHFYENEDEYDEVQIEETKNDQNFEETILLPNTIKNRKFKRKYTKKRVQSDKNEEDSLQCDLCGIICSNSNDLKNHLKLHSNVREFQCLDCEKKFKTRLALKIHMRSHTGERPYVCETCGKAFKTCSAVNNHRAIHSDVKMFKCSMCDYRASTKANLKIHDRTHSGVQPYPCNMCNLRFSTVSNMHKHKRNIHDKQKIHKCDQCDRSFFSRESARKHMVTHTGDKPYTCTLCPMAYGWYNGLQKHIKSQHPGHKMPTEKSFYEQFMKDQNTINSVKN